VSGHDAVLAQLRDAVGSRHVLTGDKATPLPPWLPLRRRPGAGGGAPGTLLELWHVLQAAVQGGRRSSCRRPTPA
jgi:D-lactate dehydrogenase